MYCFWNISISKFLKHEGNLQCSFRVFGFGLLCWGLCLSNRATPRRHPGLEFDKYHYALCSGDFETAAETKRNVLEGFQGLENQFWVRRLWFCFWVCFSNVRFLKSARQNVVWCLVVFSIEHTQCCLACRISPLDQRPFHVAQEPPWTVASLRSDGDAVVRLQANQTCKCRLRAMDGSARARDSRFDTSSWHFLLRTAFWECLMQRYVHKSARLSCLC